jgi:hypothetical protein
MANQQGVKKEAASFGTHSKRICPFAGEFNDECLCSDTRSESAEAAIRVCGGNFEACEIYMRRMQENKPIDRVV